LRIRGEEKRAPKDRGSFVKSPLTAQEDAVVSRGKSETAPAITIPYQSKQSGD